MSLIIDITLKCCKPILKKADKIKWFCIALESQH